MRVTFSPFGLNLLSVILDPCYHGNYLEGCIHISNAQGKGENYLVFTASFGSVQESCEYATLDSTKSSENDYEEEDELQVAYKNLFEEFIELKMLNKKTLHKLDEIKLENENLLVKLDDARVACDQLKYGNTMLVEKNKSLENELKDSKDHLRNSLVINLKRC